MRSFALIMVACLCVVAGFSAFVPTVAAQTVPTPTFSVTVVGETNGTRQQFARNLILVPEVPIKLIVTFHNNDTMQHSFTINDVNGTIQTDSKLLNPGANVTLNFTVLSMTLIAYNGTKFRPEVAPGGGILFYCILLRAYWIGIIGIAAMLLWTIISYFLIKSSSRHFTDHREHVRKGLP